MLIEEFPANDEARIVVAEGRNAAEAILSGDDDRLLVVVGPCSIHDPKAALEYAEKLKAYADTAKDELHLIMRVYFEKPRTTVGWKGLINDPDLDGSFDINKGLHLARRLLLDIANLGLPAGSEILDAVAPQFFADLLSWGAIGARTTESQVHREMASGFSAPIGFKNGTKGSVGIAVDAIRAAREPHHFLTVSKEGVAAIVATAGNAFAHLILRGSADSPNFDPESIADAVGKLEAHDLPPYLMVDCSHGNSRKDYRNQPIVAADLCAQIAEGNRAIAAVMIESHLNGGSQKLGSDPASLEYGLSVTDSCLAWDQTVEVLDRFREAVTERRRV